MNKLQTEIDIETENRAELVRMMSEVGDSGQKTQYHIRIEKSDEKIQALALLMLHYCSGLQHCMEEQEDLRAMMVETALQAAEFESFSTSLPEISVSTSTKENGNLVYHVNNSQHDSSSSSVLDEQNNGDIVTNASTSSINLVS